MKTCKDLELSLLIKELHIQQLKHKQNILKTRIDDARKYYLDENKTLLYVNDYKEDELPIRYYMNKGAIEFIDYILEVMENGTNDLED